MVDKMVPIENNQQDDEMFTIEELLQSPTLKKQSPEEQQQLQQQLQQQFQQQEPGMGEQQNGIIGENNNNNFQVLNEQDQPVQQFQQPEEQFHFSPGVREDLERQLKQQQEEQQIPQEEQKQPNNIVNDEENDLIFENPGNNYPEINGVPLPENKQQIDNEEKKQIKNIMNEEDLIEDDLHYKVPDINNLFQKPLQEEKQEEKQEETIGEIFEENNNSEKNFPEINEQPQQIEQQHQQIEQPQQLDGVEENQEEFPIETEKNDLSPVNENGHFSNTLPLDDVNEKRALTAVLTTEAHVLQGARASGYLLSRLPDNAARKNAGDALAEIATRAAVAKSSIDAIRQDNPDTPTEMDWAMEDILVFEALRRGLEQGDEGLINALSAEGGVQAVADLIRQDPQVKELCQRAGTPVQAAEIIDGHNNLDIALSSVAVNAVKLSQGEDIQQPQELAEKVPSLDEIEENARIINAKRAAISKLVEQRLKNYKPGEKPSAEELKEYRQNLAAALKQVENENRINVNGVRMSKGDYLRKITRTLGGEDASKLKNSPTYAELQKYDVAGLKSLSEMNKEDLQVTWDTITADLADNIKDHQLVDEKVAKDLQKELNAPQENVPQQPMDPKQRSARIAELRAGLEKLQKQMGDLIKENPELAAQQNEPVQQVQQPVQDKKKIPFEPAYRAFMGGSPQLLAEMGSKKLDAALFYGEVAELLSHLEVPQPDDPAYKALKEAADKFRESHKDLSKPIPSTGTKIHDSMEALMKAAKAYQKEMLTKAGKDIALRPGELHNLKTLIHLDTLDDMAKHGVSPRSRDGMIALMTTKIHCGGIKDDASPWSHSIEFRDNTCHFDILRMYHHKYFGDFIGGMSDKELAEALKEPDAAAHQKFDTYFESVDPELFSLGKGNFKGGIDYNDPKQVQDLVQQVQGIQKKVAQDANGIVPPAPAWVLEKGGNLINATPFVLSAMDRTGDIKIPNPVTPSFLKFQEQMNIFRNLKGNGDFTTPHQMSANQVRLDMKPMLDAAKQYQRELGDRVSITPGEMNNLKAIIHLETLDSLAANNIAPDSRAGLSAQIASKLGCEAMGKHINALSSPHEMQYAMKGFYDSPEFKTYVAAMDKNELRAMANKPGSELAKDFAGYVKMNQLQKKPPKLEKDKKVPIVPNNKVKEPVQKQQKKKAAVL